ncbi:PQQ-binding-like beta-propeller repeat protein [Halorientalis pallida]|uniref:outer membrane protein assembly factor BamB family protein n=1 Tax=Halorientalis pallida TaxID=2479928 RepID=UPI003C6EEEAA
MTRRPPLSRRTFLSGVGALGLGAGALVASADGTDGPDWPMYRHDPAGTAHAPDASVPRARPTERWRYEFDDVGGLRTPAPILHDGRVFVARRSLTAFDADSGDRIFRLDPDDDAKPFLSTPAVASARAYVTPSLVAATEYGLRAVGIGGGPDLPLTDGSGLAQRWSTGQQPNNSAVSSLNLGSGWQSPAVAADGTVYAPEDGIVAIDASSGSIRWSEPRQYTSTPSVADGGVYAVTFDGVRELAVEDGTVRWSESVPDIRPDLPPVVADGRVYVGHETGLVAMDADGGNRLWTTGPRSGDHGQFFTPPAVTSDAVYAAGTGVLDDGSDGLVALDPETGERLWDAPLSMVGPNTDGPVVAGGVVVQPGDHDLDAFDAATGERLWRIERDAIISQPAPGDGRFYLADGDALTAFGGA